MGLLDSLVDDMKRQLNNIQEKSELEGKLVKEGMTWKQIAANFAIEAKKIFRKMPGGFSMRGADMRGMVGNPDNHGFRKYCRSQGVRIRKAKVASLYTIEPFDNVANELKKREKNTSMFRPAFYQQRDVEADEYPDEEDQG